jgi:hypothetical protein
MTSPRPIYNRNRRSLETIAMATVRRVVRLLALFVLAACASPDDPPVTCDAWDKCEPDVSISANRLACRAHLDDPVCGQAYRGWLACHAGNCSPGAGADADDVDLSCHAQREAWLECRNMRLRDAVAE